MKKERLYLRLFLLLPALFVLYFVYQIFLPFLQPIALAVVLSTLCYPVYQWVERKLKQRRNLASLLTCVLVMAVIVLPLLGLLGALAAEVAQVYGRLQDQVEGKSVDDLRELTDGPYVRMVLDWVGQYVDLSQVDFVGGLASALREVSVFLLRHSTTLLGGAFEVVGKFFLMVATMFFLFRDGARFVDEFSSLSPLSKQYEAAITNKFREVTRATILGSLATAVAQGLAGGLVFLLLGIDNIIFWSSSMALFSLVPVVGTAIIWVPWVIYFLLTGSIVKAIILAVAASLFVGMIDNVIRPLFIEGRAGMHTLLVFFSLMGGVSYFGMSGLLFGPILVALFLTFVELFRLEFKEELAKPTA
jgi:predicted PurR-regulated permease PerM